MAAANIEAETSIILGPREQLFHLLADASEIEHTLMCTYLYAAFSLKQAGGPFSAREAEAIGRWRKEILAVATEEMVHLLLVANLSIALGGRPHFGRPNFPVAAGYFPSGVVVKLTPFNMETLDHFVFLERPRGVHHADGEGFDAEADYERREAHHGLMPSIQDYNTIGRLYDALRTNLSAAARRIGEGALFIGPIGGQVGPDVVNVEGVRTIDTLASALEAIDTIVDQGEGSSRDREDSHYQRFVRMRQEYRAIGVANPRFAPAWPAAESPVMRQPPEPDDKVFVDDPTAARVLDLANAIYGLILRLLVQSFGRQGPSARQVQERNMTAAIDLMHLLGRVSSSLATLPASSSKPGVNAGMSFTMLRGVEPFFAGSEERLTGERLTEIAVGAGEVGRLLPALADVASKILALNLAPK